MKCESYYTTPNFDSDLNDIFEPYTDDNVYREYVV